MKQTYMNSQTAMLVLFFRQPKW